MWSDIVRSFLIVVLSIAFLVLFGAKNVSRYREGGIANIRNEEDRHQNDIQIPGNNFGLYFLPNLNRIFQLYQLLTRQIVLRLMRGSFFAIRESWKLRVALKMISVKFLILIPVITVTMLTFGGKLNENKTKLWSISTIVKSQLFKPLFIVISIIFCQRHAFKISCCQCNSMLLRSHFVTIS